MKVRQKTAPAKLTLHTMNSTNEQNWRIQCPPIKGHATEGWGERGRGANSFVAESKVRLTNCQATHFAVFIFVLSDATQGAGEREAGGGEGQGGIRKNSKLIEQFKANFCFSRLFFFGALATVSCGRWACRCQKGHDRHGRERCSQWVSEWEIVLLILHNKNVTHTRPHVHTCDVCVCLWVDNTATIN